MLLVRHAWAGDRERWTGEDRLRPLDDRGLGQARALAVLLRGYDIDRIVSSPYVRCRETVEPLARAIGLDVRECDELGEELQDRLGAALVRELMPTAAVACCHGGMAERVCGETQRKGEAFVLDRSARIVARLRPD